MCRDIKTTIIVYLFTLDALRNWILEKCNPSIISWLNNCFVGLYFASHTCILYHNATWRMLWMYTKSDLQKNYKSPIMQRYEGYVFIPWAIFFFLHETKIGFCLTWKIGNFFINFLQNVFLKRAGQTVIILLLFIKATFIGRNLRKAYST